MNDDYSPYLLAGGALYVAGVPGVTMLFNVPRNNALARIEPGSPEAAAYWRRYLVEWTAWNHVRVVTGFAAVAAYALALNVG